MVLRVGDIVKFREDTLKRMTASELGKFVFANAIRDINAGRREFRVVEIIDRNSDSISSTTLDKDIIFLDNSQFAFVSDVEKVTEEEPVNKETDKPSDVLHSIFNNAHEVYFRGLNVSLGIGKIILNDKFPTELKNDLIAIVQDLETLVDSTGEILDILYENEKSKNFEIPSGWEKKICDIFTDMDKAINNN